jgi:Bacteriophage lambda head decoration protein D
MRMPSPLTVVNATILGSQGTILPNTVLGIVTASGKLKVAASGSSDGSQTLAAISTTVIDTSSGDVVAPVVIGHASYPKTGLIYSGSDTASTFFNALGQAKSGVSLFVY